jgi:hypothetical protein
MRLRLPVTFVYLITVACLGDTESVGTTTQNQCNCDIDPAPCCCTSPILIDVAGDGFRLTSSENGVRMATRRGHERTERAWTEAGSDDAWLVLDRNGDGVINDMSELFGSTTPQPKVFGASGNGFLALAVFDVDQNGAVNEDDPVYEELRLWQDKNHDGESQAEELHPLNELGVVALSVIYKEDRRADAHGNLFRYSAAVYAEPDSTVGQTAWDVWLVGVPSLPIPGAEIPSQADDVVANRLRWVWRCSGSCTQIVKIPYDPSLFCLTPSLLTIGPYTTGTQQDACLLAQAQCATTLVRDPTHCLLQTVSCSNCNRTIIDIPDPPPSC